MSDEKKTRRRTTAADRGYALAQLEQGKTFEEVAEEFEVDESTVRRWHRENQQVGPAYAESAVNENAVLRRENQRLRRMLRAFLEDES